MEDAFTHNAVECGVGRREDSEIEASVAQDGCNLGDGVATKDGVDFFEELSIGGESLCDISDANLGLGDGQLAALRGDRLNTCGWRWFTIINVGANRIAGGGEGNGGVAGTREVIGNDDQRRTDRRNRLRTLILSVLAACHLNGLPSQRILSNEWKSWQDNFRIMVKNGSNRMERRSCMRRTICG